MSHDPAMTSVQGLAGALAFHAVCMGAGTFCLGKATGAKRVAIAAQI